MSYLPSSRLYEREPEPKPVTPPVDVAPVPAPKPAPPKPPKASRRATMMPKEWLVAPTPVLPVESAPPPQEPPVIVVAPAVETVTVTTSAPEEKRPKSKRNIFHKAHKVVLRHLDRSKRESGEPEPDLLWLAVMVTGSLCMGLMIWGAYSALPRFGSLRAPLRGEAQVHRLKASNDVPGQWGRDTGPTPPHIHVPPLEPHARHTDVPHMPVGAPTLVPTHVSPLPPILPHEPPAPDHRLPLAPPVVAPDLARVETPLDPLPERKVPAIFVNANRGETPMIRNWNEIAKTTFLLTALATPAINLPAAVAQDYTEQIKEINKNIKALSDKIDAIKLEEKLTRIDEKVTAAEKRLDEKITKIAIQAPEDSIEFKLLKAKVKVLEESLLAAMAKNSVVAPPAPGAAGPVNANLEPIRAQLDAIVAALRGLQPAESKRIALAPPAETPLGKPATTHVIFVNSYSQDLWLWINKEPHRIAAGTTQTFPNVSPGPTPIQVRSPQGIFYEAHPTLLPNEIYTLTATK
jgi:hypothetical protein